MQAGEELLTTLKQGRVLITGGTGFLGRHLIERLKNSDARIYIISRNVLDNPQGFDGCQCYQGDITNLQGIRELVNDIKPAFVYHLASSSLGGQGLEFVLPNFEND